MGLIIKKLPAVQTFAASAEETVPEPKAGGIKKKDKRPYSPIYTKTTEITGELAEVINAIKKTYGGAVVLKRGEYLDYGRVPSGILSVDLALAGGLKRSRGSMIVGNKSAGKSTLGLRYAAASQRMEPDKVVIYVDIEGTYDEPWAARNGVDLDRIVRIEPETGEMAIDTACAALAADNVSMIITDSIAFLEPMKELTNSAEDQLPGLQARLIGNYLRRVNQQMLIERHRGHYPLVMHLNQWRMSVGVTFGDPRVLPGGKALEFATTQQIEITNKEHLREEKEKNAEADEKTKIVQYNEHTTKITKDKTGGRIKEAKFKLIRDESMGLPVGYIDQSATVITFGLLSGVLVGSRQSFSHDDFGKWRGAPDFVKYLVEHQDNERTIVQQIVDVFRKKWGVS